MKIRKDGIIQMTRVEAILITFFYVIFFIGLGFWMYEIGRNDMMTETLYCTEKCLTSMGNIDGLCFLDCLS